MESGVAVTSLDSIRGNVQGTYEITSYDFERLPL
jgi:hypothetical protein